MERSDVERLLAQVQEHVTQCEAIVERQRSVVAGLERDGHDTATASALLNQFIATLAIFMANRDRLLKLLAPTL